MEHITPVVAANGGLVAGVEATVHGAARVHHAARHAGEGSGTALQAALVELGRLTTAPFLGAAGLAAAFEDLAGAQVTTLAAAVTDVVAAVDATGVRVASTIFASA